jgi:amino acid permease
MGYYRWSSLNTPLYLGIIFLLVSGRMENYRMQSWSRIVFGIAITKAIAIIIFFFISMFELVELDKAMPKYADSFQYWEDEGILSACFAVVDLIAAYICLKIIRRTTQYVTLLAEKGFFDFRNTLESSRMEDED